MAVRATMYEGDGSNQYGSKGGGASEQKGVHDALRRQGFKPGAKVGDVSSFTRGDHIVTTRPDGSWKHAKLGSPDEKTGTDAQSMRMHLLDLSRGKSGREDEQMSFAGRATGMRRGADVYEEQGALVGRSDEGHDPGMYIGNDTDPLPVRAVLYNEDEESASGLASAAVMRGDTPYPDKHPDAKHPADDKIGQGMGNHVHPHGDGQEAGDGGSGEIASLLRAGEGEDETLSSWVHHDKGPTGDVEPTDPEQGAAAPEAVQAEWYTGEDKPQSPHDDDEKAHDVPTDSFVDDIRRKLAIRKVMPGGDAQDMKDQPDGQKADEAEGVDQRGVPIPAEPIWSKEEVNYRYASDPSRSCGDCRFFKEPAGCALVMGMVLKTDTCDKFEPERKPGDDSVRAGMAATEVQAVLFNPVRFKETRRKEGDGSNQYQQKGGGPHERDEDPKDKPSMPKQRYVGYDDDEQQGVAGRDPASTGRGTNQMSPAARAAHARILSDIRKSYPENREAGMREAWSDEARAAAAIARAHNYKATHAEMGDNVVHTHPSGRTLTIKPTGEWTARRPAAKGPGERRDRVPMLVSKTGRGDGELANHLSMVHGDPKMETKREAGIPYFGTHKNGEAIGLKRLIQIQKNAEAVGFESPLGEVSPPGWEGTVKAMKKSKGIDNPWALAWYMKGQGYQPHKEHAGMLPPGPAANARAQFKKEAEDDGDPSGDLGAVEPKPKQPGKGGKGVALPGKQGTTKLHPSDQDVKQRWNKQDDRTERHGDPRQKQRPMDHGDQADLVDEKLEARRRKESDQIRSLARRLREDLGQWTPRREPINARAGKKRSYKEAKREQGRRRG